MAMTRHVFEEKIFKDRRHRFLKKKLVSAIPAG
jgi:hypothetical protein